MPTNLIEPVPHWFLFPSPHKGATWMALALLRPHPALKSYLLSKCRDWDRRAGRISWLHIHALTQFYVLTSTTLLPGRREGEPHIH